MADTVFCHDVVGEAKVVIPANGNHVSCHQIFDVHGFPPHLGIVG
jgi:hypothetical protein